MINSGENMKNIIQLLKRTKIIFAILLILNLCIILYHFSNKESFHSDEQWSYAHANSSIGAFLDKDIDSHLSVEGEAKKRWYNQKISSERLVKYLTVSEEGRFNYSNIFENLSKGVHPPLYYMLLHTICSFYPGTFSLWYAGALNIIFFCLIYIMFFLLSQSVLKDDKLALCAVAFWGFSRVGIDTIIFLRLYIAQTLFAVCLIYETMKMLKENTISYKRLFLIFLYSFLGIFSQYNSIFFSFFVTLVTSVVLLARKHYKLLFLYCVAMLLSLLMLFLVYPEAFDVLINSSRGSQVINSISSYKNNHFYYILTQLKHLDTIVLEQLFAYKRMQYDVVFSIFIVSIILIKLLKLKVDFETKYILAVMVLYVIYILKMPYMRVFHNRYYMSMMPFIALLFIIFIRNICVLSNINKKATIIIIAILVTINSTFHTITNNSPYLFKWDAQEKEVYDKIKNKSVFINKGKNLIWIHSAVYYMMHAKDIYITDDICDEKTIQDIKETDSPIILTYRSYIPKTRKIDEARLKNRLLSMSCLSDMGFEEKYKICMSQRCCTVWDK